MATSGSTLCGLCIKQHATNEAVVWCPECDEALCEGCSDFHHILRASKNHKTIAIDDYQNLPPFVLDIKQFCKEHSAKYQNCPIHQQPICRKCIVTNHKNCKDITILDDVIQNAKSSVAMERIEQNSKNILQKIDKIRQHYKDTIAKINEQRHDIITEISKIREKVDQCLNSLEIRFLEELSTVAEEIEKRQKDLIRSLQSKKVAVSIKSDNIDQIKMYASDFQTFLGMKTLDEQIRAEEKYLQSLLDEGSLDTVDITYKINDNLLNFENEMTKFGDVSKKSSKPPTILLDNGSCENQAQIPKPVYYRWSNFLKF